MVVSRMVDYAQYGEMKPSREKWLGEIPTSWKVLRLKRIFSIKKDIAGEEGHTVLSVTQKGIRPKAMSEKGQFAQDYSKYQLVNHGDFVMNHMDLLTGWVDVSQYDGVTSPDYRVFINNKPDQFDSGYYRYIFQLCYSARIFYGLGQGVAGFGRWRLPSDMFLNFVLPVPSISEQHAIAAYLDDQIAQIDSIIAEALASIEEYKQWKACIVFEAVTRGINSREEFRSTGNPWIDTLPHGIRLSRLGLHFDITLGKMLCPNQLDSSYTLEPYYCAANVHFSGVDESDLKEMWFSVDEKEKYRVMNGDLLVVEGGAGAGGCSIARPLQTTYVQNSIMIVRPRRKSDVRYVKYLLEMLVKRGYIDFVCNRATIPHFTKEKLSNVPFPVFPDNEIIEICNHVDEWYTRIDEMIETKTQLILDLEAYKRSLIYETVTGKRKVV